MRDKNPTSAATVPGGAPDPVDHGDSNHREMPCDGKKFFESFYKSSIRGEVQDRMTMGSISDPEARFHYNATENSLIRGVLRREPLPEDTMVEAWRFVQQRRQCRLLDIGSGTGHWIDFFREVFFVAEAVGVELTTNMATYLKGKYEDDPAVTILEADISESSFSPDLIGGPVDFISAIGVMFHIVEDDSWRRAVRNLAGLLKPGGLMFIGGDFGAETRNVQFHKIDEFSSWKEHDETPDCNEIRVNKRVRSLEDWHCVAAQTGLCVADLIRTDAEGIMTRPENDLLILTPTDKDR